MQDVEAPAGHATDASGRGAFGEGLGWLSFGCAVLVGSLRMDRLQSQGVPPYAAPGLLPGLLGIVLVVSGGLLALRGARRRGVQTPTAATGAAAAGAVAGAVAGAAAGAVAGRPPSSRQLPIVLGLCLVFGLGLVGHGLPFWLAATLFVMTSILVLQHGDQPGGKQSALRPIANAVLIGLGAGLGATFVFQDLFLVRLP